MNLPTFAIFNKLEWLQQSFKKHNWELHFKSDVFTAVAIINTTALYQLKENLAGEEVQICCLSWFLHLVHLILEYMVEALLIENTVDSLSDKHL